MTSLKPLIGISADRRLLGKHPFHCVGEKYIAAVVEGADAIAVLIPSLGDAIDFEQLLERLDALVLTGSPSNVEPHHYQGSQSDAGTWHDPHRDATTLPLIPRAVAMGLPVLGICRGFQEMNVAFGGSLHQKLHEVPGFDDHRDDETAPLEIQYGPAHDVELVEGGFLYGLHGARLLQVNSLHGQGVDRIANNLIVEARAPDGVIEAFRVSNAQSFAVAVQWHPEWQFATNPFSRSLFAAFGKAARERAAAKGPRNNK